jgi:DNA-binding HxlR family transcriptional regulator
MIAMKKYGSFCPIAKAAEILTERWTLLVLRDMLQGSRQFTDLRRGVPLMSPTLLSKRLQTLEEAGLVARRASGAHWEYHPTPAAVELAAIIESIGHWGQRWARSHLTPDELDPGALMWFMHRHFALDLLPERGLVLYFEITGVKKLKQWWFLANRTNVELCWDDPHHDVDISVYADLLTLTQIFMGDLSLSQARALDKVEIHGAKDLIRSMSAWFPRSKFADDNPTPPIADGPAKRVQKLD